MAALSKGNRPSLPIIRDRRIKSLATLTWLYMPSLSRVPRMMETCGLIKPKLGRNPAGPRDSDQLKV